MKRSETFSLGQEELEGELHGTGCLYVSRSNNLPIMDYLSF